MEAAPRADPVRVRRARARVRNLVAVTGLAALLTHSTPVQAPEPTTPRAAWGCACDSPCPAPSAPARLLELVRGSGATILWVTPTAPDAAALEICTPRGARLTVEIELTSKGNGGLRIGDLWLRVFDQHDDGAIDSGPTRLRFVDGGGQAEHLVLDGMTLLTETGVTLPFRCLIRWDRETAQPRRLFEIGPVQRSGA